MKIPFFFFFHHEHIQNFTCRISYESLPWKIVMSGYYLRYLHTREVFPKKHVAAQLRSALFKRSVDIHLLRGFPGGSGVKNLPANAGDSREEGSIAGWGRSPGGGNGNPLSILA